MTTNKVRTYAFLARVFEGQQHDPFCSVYKARVNSVIKARESFAEFENGHAAELQELSAEFRQMLAEAKNSHGPCAPGECCRTKESGKLQAAGRGLFCQGVSLSLGEGVTTAPPGMQGSPERFFAPFPASPSPRVTVLYYK